MAAAWRSEGRRPGPITFHLEATAPPEGAGLGFALLHQGHAATAFCDTEFLTGLPGAVVVSEMASSATNSASRLNRASLNPRFFPG